MNILITGASRGIGREIALKLSNNPENHIFSISRSEKGLENLSREAKYNNITVKAGDINKLSKEPEKLLKLVKNEFNTLDVLINNAGMLIPRPFSEMTPDEDEIMVATNFLSPMWIIRSLLPIIPKEGHIVNISSMSGYQGSSKYAGLSVYGAAKGALSILGESLAAEFGKEGPSINSLSLGAAQTEMLEKAFPGYKAPLKADEMADFICWFAINGNKYFNGQNIPVSLGNPQE
jgi:NAD(P)-dependent dehydrogenase (short-subunit alcohol dehydrogenase family)